MKFINKILLIVIVIIFLIGCQSTNLASYSSQEYSFNYPKTYSIEEPTQESPVLVVEGEKGRVEIFNKSDFEGGRIHGFSSSGEEEYEALYVPKEKIQKENFEIWLFYLEGDIKTKEEIQELIQSFKTL